MKIALKANINNRYLSAEYGGGISLGEMAISANRENIGEYETFQEEKLANSEFALKTAKGYYVTADINGTLRTDGNNLGAWEKYSWDGNKIRTTHGTFLTARIDKLYVPVEQTANQGTWEQFTREPLESEHPIPGDKRTGVVHANGRAAEDDQGMFHPWGVTFFWALYGWKFERDRIHEHLSWLSRYRPDYLRILGEVNWEGRSILPFGWNDYQNMLAEYVDYAYDTYGIRTELTLVGGKYQNEQEKLVTPVMEGRAHKFIHVEVANEYTRLNKITPADMVRVGKYFRANCPNLVSLSRPDMSLGYSSMYELTNAAGCNMYTPHFRRSDHDVRWSAVRQAYDSRVFPAITSNNEGQGLQSSGDVFTEPLHCSLYRATTVVCGGSFFVFHVGQGVTGIEDPNHGRPQNMWEVPRIDECMELVSDIGKILPLGVENWKVTNNGRDWHPLPLDPRVGVGFWEGSSNGAVNKNYAAVNGDRFVEVLLGVNNPLVEGQTMIGKPIRNMTFTAYNGSDLSQEVVIATKGSETFLNGRKDKMKGYVLVC